MRTVFRYALLRRRGEILGWGISLALLGVLMVSLYDTIAAQREQLQQLFESYPPELMAMFGGAIDFTSPVGFISVEFFSWMPLILGIFVVMSGSALLAGDEEKGTLDLVLAHPVSRTALFMGRLLAFVVATAAILALIWLGFMLAMGSSSMGISGQEMALPILSLFAVLMLFGGLALLLSMLLASRRLALSSAGLLLVASFFVSGLARLDESLEPVATLSPLNYYQSAEAINGLNGEWLAGLLGFAALFAVLAWWRFQRRDIRVAGEAGWQMPSLRLLSLRKRKT